MTEAETMQELVDAVGGVYQLADALRVDSRLIYRWKAGRNPIHPRQWADIAEMMTARVREFDRIRRAAVAFSNKKTANEPDIAVERRPDLGNWHKENR